MKSAIGVGTMGARNIVCDTLLPFIQRLMRTSVIRDHIVLTANTTLRTLHLHGIHHPSHSVILSQISSLHLKEVIFTIRFVDLEEQHEELSTHGPARIDTELTGDAFRSVESVLLLIQGQVQGQVQTEPEPVRLYVRGLFPILHSRRLLHYSISSRGSVRILVSIQNDTTTEPSPEGMSHSIACGP